MTDVVVDVLVVGAGPAGMEAAIACAEAGLQTLVLDEQPQPGGQIFRAAGRADDDMLQVLGQDYARGRTLLQRFQDSGAQHWAGAMVWNLSPDRTAEVRVRGRMQSVRAQALVLATGAMERPFPAPGWTLPGVMGAGAGQVLLKDAQALPAGDVILAGSGPLLYLLGWQYLRAGVRPAALVDTSRGSDVWRAWRRWGGALRNPGALLKGLQAMMAFRRERIPVYRGARDFQAVGETRVTALRFSAAGKAVQLPCDLLLLHHGVVPNVQATRALRAQHAWSDTQLCWHPCADAYGELSGLPGIFVAGDGAGIVGADSARLQGRLAGWRIAEQAGRLSSSDLAARQRPLRRALSRQAGLRAFLDQVYRPLDAHRLPADDTEVCRCEGVTAGDIRRYVALGCLGPNQMKGYTRCGMGACQGRVCGPIVSEIMAQARRVPVSEVGAYRVRPPLKPIVLGDFQD